MLIRDLIALYHNPGKTYPKTWLSACHEYGRSDIREAFDSALYVSSSNEAHIEDETFIFMYGDIVVQFVWYIYYMVGLYRQFPGSIFSLLPEVILCPSLSIECIQ